MEVDAHCSFRREVSHYVASARPRLVSSGRIRGLSRKHPCSLFLPITQTHASPPLKNW